MDPSSPRPEESESTSHPSIDGLLRELGEGDAGALQRLFTALYTELHHRADHAMARQGAGHTLQPTALVNEAYLRILKAGCNGFRDRDHFLVAASRAMRHVLVDHFRSKNAGNRPAGRVDAELDLLATPFQERVGDLEELDKALAELGERDERMARLVELRFFGGLGMDEIARILDMPKRTVERRWQTIRAWLHTRLG